MLTGAQKALLFPLIVQAKEGAIACGDLPRHDAFVEMEAKLFPPVKPEKTILKEVDKDALESK